MSCCDSPRVVIRLEVVVEGGEARVRLGKRKRGRMRAAAGCIINSPVPSSMLDPNNTPVTACNGGYCVEADGTVTSTLGECDVSALAYPSETPSGVPNDPPPEAVSTTTSGGNWSFSAVPGSNYDSINENPNNNSTLVVWFRCPAGSGDYQRTSTVYHGYLPDGPGGEPTGPIPAELTATFTGGLSRLGRVVLRRGQGGGWSAALDGGKGEVHFVLLGRTLRLLVIGPAGTVLADGKVTCESPFEWTGRGHAGPDGAAFGVTVSE